MESSVREIEDMRWRFLRMQTFLQEVAKTATGETFRRRLAQRVLPSGRTASKIPSLMPTRTPDVDLSEALVAEFGENAVNRILEDCVRACRPKTMRITGTFSSRGGISSTVEARHPRA